MEQLFNLPEVKDINYIRTRKAIEKFFNDYLLMRLMAGSCKLPTMTTTYKITPPTFSNEFHSKVEDAAIHNVDNVHTAQESVKRYEAILNQLDHMHRKILFEKYIHGYQDKEIMLDIPYEVRQYRREKRKAVIELATALGIEVLN
ncbi:hypothetical protein CHN66_06000 [Listeria monocytogenes]|nr:hypothetical protein [Listeria monocytogenes]